MQKELILCNLKIILLILQYSGKCFIINTYTQFVIVLPDFKYFEDLADEYRDGGKGTLLPLWKFNYRRGKKYCCTCLQWNQNYNDMFVAGFGSCKFLFCNDVDYWCHLVAGN